MKKYLLIGLVLFSAIDLCAQDIIVTSDAEKIEAKIVEVSKKEIKYKEFDNLDGPLFTLDLSEISTIVYANGKVVVCQQKEQSSNAEEDSFKDDENGTSEQTNITRSGNTYYYKGEAMNENSYSDFLHDNCTEAYNLFQDGSRIANAGWILFSVGVGLDVGTLIGFLITGGNSVSAATTTCSLIGLGCEIACIPTLIVGYTKKHRSAEIYNASCANKNKSQAYWSINVSQNGVGLALNF